MKNGPTYSAYVQNRDHMSHPTTNHENPFASEPGVDSSGEDDFAQASALGVDRTMGGGAPFLRPAPEDGAPINWDEPLTVQPIEFEGGGAALPKPEIFNAYPPEVQRKIMEWTDRDIRARRDDESRRQDAVLRANIARDKSKTYIPVAIVILCIICAAVTGLYTKNALFVIAFLIIALAVIVATCVIRYEQARRGQPHPPEGQYR